MIQRAISKINLYQVINEQTSDITWGCDQEWFPGKWQRLSGCGPTNVAGISLYYDMLSNGDLPMLTRSQCIARMRQVWRYVTPSLRGVSSTKMLVRGALAYSKANELGWQADSIDVPSQPLKRPPIADVLAFIDRALQSDAPVAFLNLHNGSITHLDAWHWVTLVSLDYQPDGTTAQCTIIDEGVKKQLDLVQWYQTTTLGGGFVRLDLPSVG